MAAAPRRTQAERSSATRALLLDATIDCLIELGWAATSTTEVVRRAGVSRGAQVHHYPTKDDLVLAAIERLVERRTEEFHATFAALPPDRRTPRGAFDLLWEQCFGPTFDAWLELALASRLSPALAERFVASERQFAETTTDQFQQVFPEHFGEREVAEVAMRLTFALLNGLAVSRIAGVPGEQLDAARDAFHSMTDLLISTLPGGPG